MFRARNLSSERRETFLTRVTQAPTNKSIGRGRGKREEGGESREEETGREVAGGLYWNNLSFESLYRGQSN